RNWDSQLAGRPSHPRPPRPGPRQAAGRVHPPRPPPPRLSAPMISAKKDIGTHDGFDGSVDPGEPALIITRRRGWGRPPPDPPRMMSKLLHIKGFRPETSARARGKRERVATRLSQ